MNKSRKKISTNIQLKNFISKKDSCHCKDPSPEKRAFKIPGEIPAAGMLGSMKEYLKEVPEVLQTGFFKSDDVLKIP